nr:hypothetical protein [Tanacetum cinerariifolium]
MDNLSTFESVLAFRRNKKVVWNVVLLCREIEADVPLLGELGEIGESLGAKVNESMVDPVIDEIVEPIVEVEEQMVAPAMDMEGDLSMLFGDDNDSGYDDSEGPEDDKEVWDVNEEWLIALITPHMMPVMPPLSTYEVKGPSTVAAKIHSLTLLAPRVLVPLSMIKDLCTRMGNLEYGHGLLVKKVITVSDAEVVDIIAIRKVGLRVSTVKDQMQVMAFQMVQVVSLGRGSCKVGSAGCDPKG